ncbi:MAG: phosphonopyruvate decarboxylase [Candidatus Hodarchaeales archaeon]
MKCTELWEIFRKLELDFFTGVPDSTFKDWMTFLDKMHGEGLTNIIACNECEAIAIATGYHLATGNLGIVYMQNAGEGKIVNPITSLCDPEVYSIPVFLLIGWRGEPGKKDEPQHRKMGKITLSMLEILDIPHEILPDDSNKAETVIRKLKQISLEDSKPVALIIKRGIINEPVSIREQESPYRMSREEAIKIIMDNLTGKEMIVSTTGKTSRELYEYRMSENQQPRDFYTVGGMGCASAIAFGMTIRNSDRKVLIFDGDGAVLMQMGSLATIGHYSPKNLVHIVFDNSSHDSTGGQPTVSNTADFSKVALACGYKEAKIISIADELAQTIQKLTSTSGPVIIVVKVKKGARADLGRPKTTPIENKKAVMKFLGA